MPIGLCSGRAFCSAAGFQILGPSSTADPFEERIAKLENVALVALIAKDICSGLKCVSVRKEFGKTLRLVRQLDIAAPGLDPELIQCVFTKRP